MIKLLASIKNNKKTGHNHQQGDGNSCTEWKIAFFLGHECSI